MSGLKQGEFVILASENGRNGWKPVLPKDVPEWLKHPATMGRIQDGGTAMKCDEGEKGSPFYTAVRFDDFVKHQKAAAKRARRAARNRKVLH